MTSADVEAMKTWYRQSAAHRTAYAEARRVWLSLGPVASESMRQSGEAGRQVEEAPRAWNGRPRSAGRRVFLGGALAASAAYLIARPPLELWPSYAELMADFRTEAGEQRHLRLADSVSLDLNTRTSIAIRSPMASAPRIELLAGEAAISVGAGGAPLTVLAAASRISATEADFNLRRDGAQVSISCLSGHLTVECDGVTTSLSARQQISYGDHATGSVSDINPDIVTAWQHGMLIFDSTPVAQVVAEVNRYRSGRIILMNDDIGRRLLNARLRTTETNRIIVQIVHIFGARARELPGGIVLLT